MASRDKQMPARPMSPECFQVAACMSTWPADEQHLFLQAAELLAAKRITFEAWEEVADLFRAGKLTRREAFAYLGQIENRDEKP